MEDALRDLIVYSQTTLLCLVVLTHATTGLAYSVTWSTQPVAGRAFAHMVTSRALHLCIYGLTVYALKHGWDVSLPQVCLHIDWIHQVIWMSEYSWLFVVCWDFWKTFKTLEPRKSPSLDTLAKKRKYLKYSIFAWGAPVLIVSFEIILYFAKEMAAGTYIPDFGSCVVSRSALVFYIIPVISIFVLGSTVLMAMTQRAVHLHRNEVSLVRLTTDRKDDISSFKLFWKLAVLMGINWPIEFILGLTLVFSVNKKPNEDWSTVPEAIASRLGLNAVQGKLVFQFATLLFILYMFACAIFFFVMLVLKNRKMRSELTAVFARLRRKQEVAEIVTKN